MRRGPWTGGLRKTKRIKGGMTKEAGQGCRGPSKGCRGSHRDDFGLPCPGLPSIRYQPQPGLSSEEVHQSSWLGTFVTNTKGA